MAKLEKLSRRERQVMDVVYELEEASAKEIQQRLPDPPSYSAVRAVLTRLVNEGALRFRESGLKYIYRAAESKQQTRRKALRKVIDTFFEGSAVHMMHALLGTAANDLSAAELDELEQAIADARKERT